MEQFRKASMKASQSILTMVAAVSLSSDFYQMRLQRYLKYLPGIVSHGHAISSYQRSLAEMKTADVATLQALEGLMKGFQAAEAALPPGSMAEVKKDMVRITMTFARTTIASAEPSEPETLVLLQKLLAEISVLEPLQADLVELQTGIGEQLVSAKSTEVFQGLKKHCEALEEALDRDDADHTSIVAAMDAFPGELDQFVGSHIPTDCREQLKSTCQKLANWIAGLLVAESKTLTELQQYAIRASQLGSMLGATSRECFRMSLMVALVKCLEEEKELDAMLSETSAPVATAINRLAAMGRAGNAVKQLHEQLKEVSTNMTLDPILEDCVQKIQTRCHHSYKKQSLDWSRKTHATLVEQVQKLVPLAEGNPAGGLWVDPDSRDSMDMSALLKAAENTLLKMNLGELKTSIVSVSQAEPVLVS